MCVNGRDCLNLATHNYLGLVGSKNMEDSAVQCIKKYGVGSCGPRGFYGTVGEMQITVCPGLKSSLNLSLAITQTFTWIWRVALHNSWASKKQPSTHTVSQRSQAPFQLMPNEEMSYSRKKSQPCTLHLIPMSLFLPQG